MFKPSLFHEGEIAIQKRTQQTLAANANAIAISNKLPGGASQFIAQLQMVVIGSMDSRGKIWTSIIFGQPSFVQAKDAKHLSFNKEKSTLLEREPLLENIKNNASIGLLFIDLETRIRLRVNGRIRALSPDGFTTEIVQAYPNCPKYIQRRKLTISDEANDKQTGESQTGTVLGTSQRSLIQQADTCFVASAHLDHGIDCSHRGGQAGFVQIINNHCLRVPDYAGNSLFNTLGNFQSYPFAGLVFIDFETQRLLQLIGKAKILWDLDDADNASGGTKRFWDFEIESWRENPVPYSVSWDYLDASPFNPSFSKPATHKYLSLRVEKITQLTPRIKSFVLRDSEHAKLPSFEPGAHLPITIINKEGQAFPRQYSLISDPLDTAYYAIAVLEAPQGQGGSLAMHHDLHEGNLVQASPPSNNFQMVDNAGHSVLIAGGIGLTPLFSMLHKLSAEKKSFEMHYAARTHQDFAFLDEIKELAGDKLFCYTSEEAKAKSLDLYNLLEIPKADTHIYVCGPKGMIDAVRAISKSTGWRTEQIHFESFGVQAAAEDNAFDVYLSQSKKTIHVAANQSILDNVLDTGIDVPHQCRRGECSMCMTTVLSGEPDHRDLCLSDEQRKSTMCICVSRAMNDDLVLNL